MKEKFVNFKNFLFHSKFGIIGLVAILVALIAAVSAGLFCYNNYLKEQKISDMKSEIVSEFTSFEKEERNDKYNSLEELIKEYNAYISNKDSENYFEEVKKSYEENISNMRDYFISGYEISITENTIESLKDSEDKEIKNSITNLVDLKDLINKESEVTIGNEETLKDYNSQIDGLIKSMRDYFIKQYDSKIKNNTLKNVNKIDDKSKLKKTVENLNNFKKSLNKEANTTLADEEKLKSYNKTIDDLISDYNDRIGEIKKAEEEAKKKVEEEAEATENQNNSYDNSYDSGSSNNTNYNSNDNNYSGGSSSGGSGSNSGNSSGNSSGSSGNNNSSNNSDYKWWSWTDENGTDYRDNQGNHWTDNGGYYHGDGGGWYNP